MVNEIGGGAATHCVGFGNTHPGNDNIIMYYYYGYCCNIGIDKIVYIYIYTFVVVFAYIII